MTDDKPFDEARSAAIKHMLMVGVSRSTDPRATARRRAGLVAALVATALVLAGGSAALAFNAGAIFRPAGIAPTSPTPSPGTPRPNPTSPTPSPGTPRPDSTRPASTIRGRRADAVLAVALVEFRTHRRLQHSRRGQPGAGGRADVSVERRRRSTFRRALSPRRCPGRPSSGRSRAGRRLDTVGDRRRERVVVRARDPWMLRPHRRRRLLAGAFDGGARPHRRIGHGCLVQHSTGARRATSHPPRGRSGVGSPDIGVDRPRLLSLGSCTHPRHSRHPRSRGSAADPLRRCLAAGQRGRNHRLPVGSSGPGSDRARSAPVGRRRTRPGLRMGLGPAGALVSGRRADDGHGCRQGRAHLHDVRGAGVVHAGRPRRRELDARLVGRHRDSGGSGAARLDRGGDPRTPIDG